MLRKSLSSVPFHATLKLVYPTAAFHMLGTAMILMHYVTGRLPPSLCLWRRFPG